MKSQIAICNHALTKIGEQRIISLGDDNKAARALTSAWDICLNSELRAHNWRFAITRTRLAALSTAPDWGFQYQYQLPSDNLRLIQVNDYIIDVNAGYYNQRDTSMYQLESNKILTDLAAPLKIRYVRQVVDTTEFDALFDDVLACKLAMQICEEITDSGSLKQAISEEYKQALRNALKANAMEITAFAINDSNWINDRL